MERRFVSVVALLAASGAAVAEPPTEDLPGWRGPCYNCFNYAVNSRDVYFAQLTPPFTCDNMRTQVLAAGLTAVPWTPGQPVPTECDGGCLVALVADIDSDDPEDHDFHWYRLNGNGRWSHKQGMLPATDKGAGGQAAGTWNPTQPAARGNYETFCGFFCVPTGGDLDLDGTDSWQAILEAARLRKMQQSGVEPVPLRLEPLELLPIVPRLPTGLPVPDPEWGNLPDFPGLGLQFNPDFDPTLPPFLVVHEGIVGIYSQLDGPFVNIQYVVDDQGLEPVLRDLLSQQPCSPADIAPQFGILDLSDVSLFVTAFVSQDPVADIAPPLGVFDLNDVSLFINAFLAGCP